MNKKDRKYLSFLALIKKTMMQIANPNSADRAFDTAKPKNKIIEKTTDKYRILFLVDHNPSEIQNGNIVIISALKTLVFCENADGLNLKI